MKRKMIFPLMVVLLAAASAFASMPLSQTAWFNDSGEVGEATITTPSDKPCAVGRSIQCTIGSLPAYDTQANAQSQNASGLLKYNNN